MGESYGQDDRYVRVRQEPKRTPSATPLNFDKLSFVKAFFMPKIQTPLGENSDIWTNTTNLNF